uniref:Protein ABIL5 n=1 Tax=Solanum tuberosum TaxID=4113 RepID=M0ZHE2_SOLTU
VLENTKEYLCRAVVTVVDHLGCVSAKLECKISTIDTASETELRIDGLTQRLATCQQYSHKLALTSLCWNTDLATFHRRYISPLLPVRDGLSVVPKSQNSNFEFQEARKQKRNILSWKPMHNKDIRSLIRRGRRIVT